MRLFLPPYVRLRYAHSSSSLPLQSSPSPHLTLRAFSRNHLLLHTKRSNCALPPPELCPHALTPARSRTATRAHTSPPRCTSHLHPHAHVSSTTLLRTMEIQRLLVPRALHTQPLLPRFFTSTVLPRRRAREAESVPRVHETQATCGRQLTHCRN